MATGSGGAMSRAVARATLLHMLPGHLAAAGVEPQALLNRSGLTAADIASGRVVPRAQIHHALTLSARCVGVAELGLALGGSADAAKLGPIGRAMAAGQTAEACLQAHIAAMPTLQSHISLQLRKHGAEAVLAHGMIGDGETCWLLYEGAAAFNVSMLRNLLGADWTPERIVFPHSCKGRRSVYEDWFRAPVQFGSGTEACIHMRREALSRPLRRSEHPTSGSAARHDAEGEVALVSVGAADIHCALARIVEATLGAGPATLRQAAQILGLSPRTVQRRLADHGTDFETLVDDHRRRRAKELLARPLASVTEVAMSLGYSDAAHFNRAFRRWEDQSPQEFRRTRAAPPA